MSVISLFKKKIKIYGVFLLEGKDVILSEFANNDVEEKSIVKAAGLIDEMLKITGRENIMSIFVSSSESNILLLVDNNVTIGVVVDKNEIPGKVEFEVSDVKDKIIEEGKKVSAKVKVEEEKKAEKEEKAEKKEGKEEIKVKEERKEESPTKEKESLKEKVKKVKKIEDFELPPSVMDELFNIAEEYLMDFVDDVWSNNIEEYGVNEDKPTYRKLMSFIEGMEEATSMMLGHAIGEEMGQRMRDVVKKI